MNFGGPVNPGGAPVSTRLPFGVPVLLVIVWLCVEVLVSGGVRGETKGLC